MTDDVLTSAWTTTTWAEVFGAVYALDVSGATIAQAE